MKRSGRSTRIELPITTHSLGRRQRLDLDTALPQLVERLRVGTQLPVRAGAHDQALRQVIDSRPPSRQGQVGVHRLATSW